MKILIVGICFLTMTCSWASDRCTVELIEPTSQITEEDMRNKGYVLGDSPIKVHIEAGANCYTERGLCGFDASIYIWDDIRKEKIYSKFKHAEAKWLPVIGWFYISNKQYLRSIRKLIPNCNELLGIE